MPPTPTMGDDHRPERKQAPPLNYFIDIKAGWLRAGWNLQLPSDEYIQLPASWFERRKTQDD
jgi:hypothetical protein